MNTLTQTSEQNSIISATEAGKQFGYTNDYIARLAREKKVAGSRIGRQWFVDTASLQLFMRQSEIAKREYAEKVRLERKMERVQLGESANALGAGMVEVMPMLSSRAHVLAQAGVVVCASFVVGAFLYVSAVNTPVQEISSASVMEGLRALATNVYAFGRQVLPPRQEASVAGAVPVMSVGEVGVATATVRVAVNQNAEALVVLPQNNLTSESDIRNSFSDDVSVVQDADGDSGIITPTFSSASTTHYRYLLVPVRSP